MKKVAAIVTASAGYLLSIAPAFAQIGLKKDSQGDRGFTLPGSSGTGLGVLIANVINLFFVIGAIGFTIMILWGAVNWILSGGDKEKIAGARKRITTSIIGLVLLSASFVVFLVIGQILGIGSLQNGKYEIKGLLVP